MGWTISDIEKLREQGKIKGYKVIGGGAPKSQETPKRSKYGNVKCVVDGIKFDSTKEGNRYIDLKMLQQAGQISDLRTQVKFQLFGEGHKGSSYVADFTYTEKGKQVVEDVKSDITRKKRDYRLKKKLMLNLLGIEILET